MATDPEAHEMEALRVHVENFGAEREAAADWGSWQTFVFSATSNVAQQILAQNNRRKGAQLSVNGTTGFVRVGTRGQVMNAQGGQLFAGAGINRINIENKQELWMVGDGVNTITVTVIDERYE
jgi:hypothetical protein